MRHEIENGTDTNFVGSSSASRATRRLRIDAARLHARLAALGEIGRDAGGGVTRLAYTAADREGRAYVREAMRQAGLDPYVDAAGNLIGRRAGRDPALPPLVMGSHVDTVPNGGIFDGPLGVLGAIEVVQTLAEHGITTRHALEVIVFQNEEGGLFGSRAVAESLSAAELDMISRSGVPVRDGIRSLGGDPDRLASARREPGSMAAYIELHIEQGDALDAARTDIGVVEGIVGIGQWEVTWEGEPNHAGTTSMDRRRDALVSAASFVQTVNRTVRQLPGRQVGTVGRFEAFPGAANVIPGRVVASLELRDTDANRIRALFDQIRAEAERIAGVDGTRATFRELAATLPAPADPRIRTSIAAAARALGLSATSLPSGAGHDAQAMARIGPAGMVFVPSVGGISHSPREFTRTEDVANGANVLLHALLRLDEVESEPNRGNSE